MTEKDIELRKRLENEHVKGEIKSYGISIEDLQTVAVLESRKKLSKGELSTLAFASRINQAFLSDDINAAKFARTEIDPSMVQTTSQLLMWLFFQGHLLDGDKDEIISDLESFGRNMRIHYEKAYHDALMFRLTANNGGLIE